MIIGGSRIAVYLAEFLLRAGTNVKIIELDAGKAAELASKLPQATVINADGTNQNVLQSENISQMDTVVAVTNMDEENLINSMYAKHVGVPQVVTKTPHDYTELFRIRASTASSVPSTSAPEIIR